MIDVGYAHMMSKYNVWQNNQLSDVIKVMSIEDLTKERGAFFGSILGTTNHLLWADTLWLNRFDPSIAAPEASMAHSTTLYPTYDTWRAQRIRVDGDITRWAQALDLPTLRGLATFRRAQDREVTKPMSECVVHFFNHQTHHRGQIHAMLTAAGQEAPVSDLSFMPEAV